LGFAGSRHEQPEEIAGSGGKKTAEIVTIDNHISNQQYQRLDLVFEIDRLPTPRCLEKVLYLRRTSDGEPVREGATRQGKAQDRTFRSPLLLPTPLRLI
jgi:hypothetical protein